MPYSVVTGLSLVKVRSRFDASADVAHDLLL